MAKRNMGKVKHYSRSFYTGGQRAKQIAGTLAVLLALFLVGWLAGPAVIDFGTSTWYKIKNGGAENPEPPAAVSGSVPEETAQPEATPEPQQPDSEPVVQTGVPGEGGWAFVSVTAAQTAEQAAQTAAQMAQQGVKYAVFPFKDAQGYVYYESRVAAAKSSISSTTFDAAAAAAAFKEAGITPVASICVFKDPLAATANRNMAVKYQDQDYLWLDRARDKGGKPWLNPASPQAVGYIADLIQEATELGYPEVWLSNLAFPPETGRSKANFGPGMQDRTMDKVLADALAVFSEKAVCWVEYPLNEVARGAENPLLGAEPAALGIKRLVLHTDEAPDAELLTAVVGAARAGGVETIALLEGNQVQLQ